MLQHFALQVFGCETSLAISCRAQQLLSLLPHACSQELMCAVAVGSRLSCWQHALRPSCDAQPMSVVLVQHIMLLVAEFIGCRPLKGVS